MRSREPKQDHHVQVHPDRGGLLGRPPGQDRLDDEQPAAVGHGRAAGGEDATGVRVVPVVEHPRQQVGVGTGRHRGEEVAVDEPAPVGEPGGGQPLPCPGEHRGPVHERRRKLGGGADDRLQQHAFAPADVDEAGQPAEVVGGDDVGGLAHRPAGHRALERRLVRGVAVEVLEEAFAVDVLERRPAGAYRVEQTGRGPLVQLAPDDDRAVQRPGDPGAHRRSERGEREPAVVVLGEHLLDDEPAQDPRHGVPVGTHRAPDLRAREGSVGQRVGDAEPRRDVQQLRGQVAVHEPGEPGTRIVGHVGPLPGGSSVPG
ncbi:hypothetical protein Voc01_070090 [Virgisporangium ochraceum]|uniref:Uncharacterized protein n=1 Tax=Virgisporangium ochraceum TaxID=65505 RepID=A0A8J3ZXU8_9ACTN|nr:hypothetical protein Voc01_070090 [Virgisporangium ochraceum]